MHAGVQLYVPKLNKKIIDILQTEDTYIDMDKIVKMKNVILFCPLFLKLHPFLGWIVLVYIWQ